MFCLKNSIVYVFKTANFLNFKKPLFYFLKTFCICKQLTLSSREPNLKHPQSKKLNLFFIVKVSEKNTQKYFSTRLQFTSKIQHHHYSSLTFTSEYWKFPPEKISFPYSILLFSSSLHIHFNNEEKKISSCWTKKKIKISWMFKHQKASWIFQCL